MINPNQLRGKLPASASQWMLVGLRGSGAVIPPFDPASITGLKGWWKADALPVVADNTEVTLFSDSSSNANNATAVVSHGPRYFSNITGGKPILSFSSGIGSIMTLTTPIPASAEQGWTVFSVMRNFAAGYSICSLGSTVAGGYFGINVRGDGNSYLGSQSFSIGRSPVVDSSGQFHVFTGTQSRVLRIDGVTVGITGVTALSPSNLNTMGASVDVAADGSIAEILAYNSNLATSDMVSVETYLKTKYSLP